MSVFVKICGLTTLGDAELALSLGADALGFVLEPTSPRYLTLEDRQFVSRLGPMAQTFAVFGPAPAELPDLGVFSAIQISSGQAAWSGRKLSAVRLKSDDTVESVLDRLAGLPWAHLEPYTERGYGGTGTPLDWGLAAEVVAAAQIPIVVAGGLNPTNVSQVIRQVRPYGVDVSSGVEARLRAKDPEKLRAFIEAAKST
jgi:phosphoribosylanthranilate isomerase